MIDPTVFNVFPDAIRWGWKIGRIQRATEHGDVLVEQSEIDVIVSDSANSNTGSQNAEMLDNDCLIYCKPEQLPTKKCGLLIANYVVIDDEGLAYNITSAGEGFNQHTGVLEHIELKLKLTEVVANV